MKKKDLDKLHNTLFFTEQASSFYPCHGLTHARVNFGRSNKTSFTRGGILIGVKIG